MISFSIIINIILVVLIVVIPDRKNMQLPQDNV